MKRTSVRVHPDRRATSTSVADDTASSPQAGVRWTAIVLAGTRPGGDPLAAAFGMKTKAEVPVLGVPMVEWVCATLLRCPQIDHVVVLTGAPDHLLAIDGAPSLGDPRVTVAPCLRGIAQSILAVAGEGDVPWPILVTTVDHPLLTPRIVGDFLDATGTEDLALGAVERTVILAAEPEAKRTWLRFADGAFSGANLFALRGERARHALELWSKAEGDRKRVYKLFLRFGPVLAARAMLRQLTFADAIRLAGRRLGLTARLVELPYADAAIDVDKIGDHRQVEAILSRREDGDHIAPAGPARVGVSVFDLDRTLTRRPTYTALLIFAAARLAPWRLLLIPAVIVSMLGYVLHLVTRKRLKEIEHQLLLGASIDRHAVDCVADAFARRLSHGGFYDEGIARISDDRAKGRRIVLATAANQFYVEAIARALQLQPDEVIATRSSWADGRLTPLIDGANCYGAAKRDMLDGWLQRQGLRRCDIDLRFFTDHVSDRPTLDWADEPFAVNPSARLRKLARARGWPVLHWH